MHSFQTIPPLLVSFLRPLTSFHPPPPTLQVSISIHVTPFLYFPPSSVYPPFLSVCFAEAALLHFPLTRWENPWREFYTDCLALSHLGSHLLRILRAPYRASTVGEDRERRRKEGALSASVVYDYRSRKTMRVAWQTYASLGESPRRIMLSTT